MILRPQGRRAISWTLAALTSAIVFFNAFVAGATQVSYRTLDQVVPDSPLIFTAEIARAIPTDTLAQHTTEYEIRDVRALRGTPPGGLDRVRHVEPLAVVRDSSGKIVMEQSFTLDASGHEREATSGRWLFFGVAAPGVPFAVRRVEPIASEGKVRAMLQSRGDAAAPAPPVDPDHPAASAAASVPSGKPAPTEVPPGKMGRSGCAIGAPVSGGRTPSLLLVVALGTLAAFGRRRRGCTP